MTPPDLDALEKLADEGTPGPWNDSGQSIDDFDAECMMRMEWIVNGTPDDGEEDAVNANYRADAAFIAAANPATIKALIAELKEARGLISLVVNDAFDCQEDSCLVSHRIVADARTFLARNGKGEING